MQPWQCRICGGQESAETYTVREMMFGTRTSFAYDACAACGSLQIRQVPGDLSAYYPEDYYSLSAALPAWRPGMVGRMVRRARLALPGLNRGAVGRALDVRFPLRDPRLKSLAPLRPRRGSRILDVGCGAGGLVQTLAGLGFRNVMGTDPYLEADRRLEGGAVLRKAALEDLAGSWDIIMYHHVLEHVTDPRSTMKAVADRLSPGGACIVRVPTVSSYAWRHYVTDWVQWDAPRHLHLFSRPGLRLLAEHAGLDDGGMVDDSTELQFWGSEQFQQDIPLHDERSYFKNPDRSIFTPGVIENYRSRARELNREHQGDQVVCYFRKRAP